MALHGIFFQELLLGALILAAAVETEINSSCDRKCGSVSIPYPFGTSEDCYLDPSFLITCNQTFNPPKPFLGTGQIEVLDISLNGELRVSNWVARRCYSENGNEPWLRLTKFLVSYKKNKFTAVGCNTVAYIKGRAAQGNFTTGCVSSCDAFDGVVNSSCNGFGCCQSSIPKSVTSFTVYFGTLNNDVNVTSFNPCSFGFLIEEEAYKFSRSDLVNLQDRERVPLMPDWTVGNETCLKAQKNQTNYACKAAFSECYNATNGLGYRCRCFKGYSGNPYLPGGCRDIDECKISKPCNSVEQCINVNGTFKCVCREGYKEYKRRDEMMCSPQGNNSRSLAFILGLSTSIGLLVLLVSGWLFYKIIKKMRRIKQKKKFFKRNDGLLLQQQLFSLEANIENTKLFTSKELEKATDHFNVNRILGQRKGKALFTKAC